MTRESQTERTAFAEGATGRGVGTRLGDEDLIDGQAAATLGFAHAHAEDSVALRAAVDEALTTLPTSFVVALRASRREGPARFESRDAGRFKLAATFEADLRYVHASLSFMGCTLVVRVEPDGRRYRGSVVAIDATMDAATRALRLLGRDWRVYLDEARREKPAVNAFRVIHREMVDDV